VIVIARYDAAVIGSGPAGLEAAINLKIRQKNFLLFGSEKLSSKLEKAPKIDNYLGFPDITGMALKDQFLAHLENMDISISVEQVTSLFSMGDYFALATNKNTYEATAVIIASGVVSSAPFPGEERLLGRGVGYCATCDAPLYRGKTVAIVGYGNEAAREANFVSELAAKVYYIPAARHTVELDPKVEVISAKVEGIQGDVSVSTLKLSDRTLEADGVFILRESISPTTLAPGIAMREGYIEVDHNMQTSIPGCFAAGDCTGKPHQYMRAAGQGQTAALNAVNYIDIQKKKNK